MPVPLPFSLYFECCRYAQNLTKYNLKIFQVGIARFYIRLLKDFERSDHWAEVVCHCHLPFITWIITNYSRIFMNDYFWVLKSLIDKAYAEMAKASCLWFFKRVCCPDCRIGKEEYDCKSLKHRDCSVLERASFFIFFKFFKYQIVKQRFACARNI